MSAPIPLHQLRPGQNACIDRLAGCPFDIARLSEMGLQPGTPVSVMRGGKTCILRLGNCCMCVRTSNDTTVFVKCS